MCSRGPTTDVHSGACGRGRPRGPGATGSGESRPVPPRTPRVSPTRTSRSGCTPCGPAGGDDREGTPQLRRRGTHHLDRRPRLPRRPPGGGRLVAEGGRGGRTGRALGRASTRDGTEDQRRQVRQEVGTG